MRYFIIIIFIIMGTTIWSSVLGKQKQVKNNVKEVKKEHGKINTNVVLTDFEKEVVLPKLSTVDPETWEMIRELRVSDIYWMTIYEKEDDDWEIVKTKFLSIAWRFINDAWTKCSVTIVVVWDKRFYMSLGNQEYKEKGWQDLFINHLDHMLTILDNMTWSSMSEEDIEAEVESINTFWTK